MTDEQFMRQAIMVAHESAKTFKHPIGAILVKEGQVISKGLSHDHNFHAEHNCIHQALKLLNTSELTGCTLYTTQESCLMCFAAALYANVDRLVFGAYANDLTESNTYEYPNFSLDRFAGNAIRFDGGKMQLTGGVLRGECKALMAEARYWSVA